MSTKNEANSFKCFDCGQKFRHCSAMYQRENTQHAQKRDEALSVPLLPHHGSREDDFLRFHIKRDHPTKYRDVIRDIKDTIVSKSDDNPPPHLSREEDAGARKLSFLL